MEKKTILIVEDEIDSYTLLSVFLRKMDYNIAWAKDGESAVKRCKEDDNIVLVLMDIRLPIMNGYDATRAIKQFKPNLPIIAQTAYAIQGDKEKAFEANCDEYISKPINSKLLFKLLDKYL